MSVLDDIKNEKTRKTAIINASIAFLIFVLILLCYYHINPFSFLDEGRTYRVNLCSVGVGSESILEIIDNKESDNYVPDYQANIDIKAPQKVVEGDNIEIILNFENDGLAKWEKPYFYLLLIYEDKEVEAYFSGGVWTDYSGVNCRPLNLETNSKWPKWEEWRNPYGTTAKKISPDEESFAVFSDKGLIATSRNDLMGNGSNIIRYVFPVEEQGNWKIFVALFDEEYTFRDGTKVPKSSRGIIDKYFGNAIQTKSRFFSVIPKDEKGYSDIVLQFILVIGGFLIVFHLVYFILNKGGLQIYSWIVENKRVIIIFIVIILLFVFYTMTECKKYGV